MISLFKVFMSPNIRNDVSSVLESGMITQSSKVEEYESELKSYFSHPYILTLNSATSGLTLAFRLLNLEMGDEVISSPLTCFATNAAILANNLKIKWVDVDPETCNIDLEDLKLKISEKTKAVCFVHWGGSPIDLDKLDEIKGYAKEKYGTDLRVVEDAAHAFGSEYMGKKIGTHGNITVFSTQAIKHLTTGDGGIISLPNEEMYERVKLLRWYGISREKRSGKGKDFRLEDDIQEWGYKYHMNDINATIGLSNLPYIDNNLLKIRSNAEYFRTNLVDVEGVTLLKQLEYSVSSYWIYTMKIVNKKGFIDYMNENNIMVSQVHSRNDNNSCLKEYKSFLPQLDNLEKSVISIPVGWWLTLEDREKIVDCIKEWCKMNTISVRNLESRDWKHYITLISQLYNVGDKFYNTEEEFEYVFKKVIENSSILVVECNGKLIGTGKIYIQHKFFDNIAHIEDVVVDINHREICVGKTLIKELLRTVPTSCYKVILNADNHVKPFYEKLGFVKENNGMVLRV